MIRTRFAPSPTGYLHIGGVRTALFNWLLARKHGGRFILRIDDTDRQRNVDEALEPILRGLRWLGIDWDEGPEVGGPHAPYFQSQRTERYRLAAEQLVATGHAYFDYATPEEIQAEREAAEREKRPLVYSRRWMAESDADRHSWQQQGRSGVIRLKMPREGTLVLDDAVRGRVEFAWASEQDHVIVRADGTCLYHLATVVDDHDFEITDVVRAEEHLSNTPRQVFMFQALGYDLPRFAHLPYVAEPGSRNKLSKRKLETYRKHRDFARLADQGERIATALGIPIEADTFNPVIVDFYEQIGFLPDALLNYLLLLGWSLDDKTETFSREEMIDRFSLARVNKAPASFDPAKLLAFEARRFGSQTATATVDVVLPFLQKSGWLPKDVSDDDRRRLEHVVAAAGDRLTAGGDILEFVDFFTPDDRIPLDARAVEKRLAKPPAAERLQRFRKRLADLDPFTAETTEAALRAFLESEGIKIGDIIHALRVAVTGKAVGFGMFETLAILGKTSTLARIDRALSTL